MKKILSRPPIERHFSASVLNEDTGSKLDQDQAERSLSQEPDAESVEVPGLVAKWRTSAKKSTDDLFHATDPIVSIRKISKGTEWQLFFGEISQGTIVKITEINAGGQASVSKITYLNADQQPTSIVCKKYFCSARNFQDTLKTAIYEVECLQALSQITKPEDTFRFPLHLGHHFSKEACDISIYQTYLPLPKVSVLPTRNHILGTLTMLARLKEAHIAHLDITANNIVFSEDGIVYGYDFGASVHKIFDESTRTKEGLKPGGTPGYGHPDHLLHSDQPVIHDYDRFSAASVISHEVFKVVCPELFGGLPVSCLPNKQPMGFPLYMIKIREYREHYEKHFKAKTLALFGDNPLKAILSNQCDHLLELDQLRTLVDPENSKRIPEDKEALKLYFFLGLMADADLRVPIEKFIRLFEKLFPDDATYDQAITAILQQNPNPGETSLTA